MSKNRIRGFSVLNKPGASDIDRATSLKLADEDRGLLLNRLTTAQRDVIINPPEGLLIYNLDTHAIEVWNGTTWEEANTSLFIIANTITVGSTATIGTDLTVGGNTTLGGDLSAGGDTNLDGDVTIGGNLGVTGGINVGGAAAFTSSPTIPTPTNPTDAANKSYVDGKFPVDLGATTGNLPLSRTTGNLPVGQLNSGTSASNITFWRGDGTWTGIDLSGAQVIGNLPVSHLNSGTSASTSTFWRGDGSWTQVSLANVTGDLTVSHLNGGTGASSTTFWRGDASWSQISLTTDVTGNLPLTQVSGNLAVSHLDTGTNASATTFWRGDATWTHIDLSTDVTGNLPLSQVTGNLTVSHLDSGTNASANTFWQGDGTWAKVSLDTADITGNLPVTNLNGGLNAAATTFWRGDATWDQVNLTSDVTGNLPLTQVSGNLTVSHLNSGTGASATTFWRGDATWNQINLATDVSGNLPLTQTSGNLSVSHLNTGTNASVTTYWRGDGTWTSIDLSTAQVSGTLASARISGSYTGITGVGTLTVGTWNSDVIAGQYGGTGVANAGKTISLGGNLTTSGAFATTLTVTATTNSTLPAGTHTLAGLDVAQTFTAAQTFNFGADNNLALDKGSVLTTYNIVSLNGDRTLAGAIGLLGGATADPALNYLSTSGGSHLFFVNGIAVARLASGGLTLNGSTSGTLIVKPPAAAGSNTLTLPAGTTDFSATGGASQVVKQTSAGGAFTVGQLAFTDISGTITTGQVSGSYTGITGVGTLTVGTWSATTIGLAKGGTNADLSATGGTSQVLRQSSSGAAITVSQLAASDLSNGTTGSGAVALALQPTFINWAQATGAAGGQATFYLHNGTTQVGAFYKPTGSDDSVLWAGGDAIRLTYATGDANFYGAAITTGSSVSTADCRIELGGGRSGNGNAYLDLHSQSGSDANLRLIKNSGANGLAELRNFGTGGLGIGTDGAGDLAFFTNNSTRLTITSAGASTFNGTVGATGYLLSGINFAGADATYNFLYDRAGNQTLYFGGSGDPQNYYRNTTHTIGAIGGASTYGVFNTSGLAVTGASTATTSMSAPIVNATTLQLSGLSFAAVAGNYIELFDKNGSGSIFLGSVAADPTNYYRQTLHRFGNIGGGTVYLDIGSTISATGAFRTGAQANLFGGATGNLSSPTHSNTNLLLYDNSSTNWSGIGSDVAGNMYFVTGTSAPSTVLQLPAATGNVQVTNTLITGSTIVANNAITSQGASAILQFQDRTAGTFSAWYATGGLTRFWHSSNGDIGPFINTVGDVILRNGVSLRGQDTGFTARAMALMDGSNNTLFASESINNTYLYAYPSNGAYSVYVANAFFQLTSQTAYKPGGGVWADNSERQYKDNITDLKIGLDAVRKLRPRSWTFNGKGMSIADGIRRYGLIYDETEAHIPEMTGLYQHKGHNGRVEREFKTLDATPLIYALVNATKELADRLEALERRP